MNLGIVVVYKFEPSLRPLLDVHLARIARCTSVPYTIHAAAVGLPPETVAALAATPHLALHDLPLIDACGRVEHAHYLELLTAAAFAAGASHVVTLHLDSLLLANDWVERLAAALTPDVAFVSGEQVNTACLFFARPFWEQCRPRYLTDEAGYAGFRAAHPELSRHSGSGFAYAAAQAGLRWVLWPHHPLAAPDLCVGYVYDGLLLHLSATTSLATPAVLRGSAAWAAVQRVTAPARRALRRCLPVAAGLRLRRALGPVAAGWLDAPARQTRRAAHHDITRQLLAEPDRFLARLAAET